jgi:RNA polymerase sigma-70 factor (ECF subfamily)
MFSRRRASRNSSHEQQHAAQPPTFSTIVARARNRESDALGILYHQFLPGIFAYIAARVDDRGTAEDLTSEVFLQMVEDIQQVRATSEASFAAWLLQVARGTVAGYYRKHARQPVQVPLEPDFQDHESEGEGPQIADRHPENDPVLWSEARAEWEQVAQAINLLTEEQRQVVIGRLILGYDVATVARMIGKQANAVKALQFRALQSLHRQFQKQEEGMPEQIMFNQPRCAQHQEDRS